MVSLLSELEKEKFALILDFEAKQKNATWYVNGEPCNDMKLVIDALFENKTVQLIQNEGLDT